MNVSFSDLRLNQITDFKGYCDPRKIRWMDNSYGDYGVITWARSCGKIVFADGNKYCDLYAWDHEDGIMIEMVTGLESSPYDCMLFRNVEDALSGNAIAKGGVSEYATKLIPEIVIRLFDYKEKNSDPF